ncbi:MAG: GNAT family N-acetyltransferase [Oscillospiraceae bacterium]|nr:GNAT family N-acetyltransferase [Oscillospiraceae bacterium]
MLNLSFSFYPIFVRSAQAEDMGNISIMLNRDLSNSNVVERKSISINKLRLRFIENYISDDDFFLKIQYENEIIGIIKGRINFDNSSVWISMFYIEKDYRKRGIGKCVYSEVEKILHSEYMIDHISVSITLTEYEEFMFWHNLGFSINRIVNNFYDYYDEKLPMIILNKKLNIAIHKYN